jgi:hypothetical protein
MSELARRPGGKVELGPAALEVAAAPWATNLDVAKAHASELRDIKLRNGMTVGEQSVVDQTYVLENAWAEVWDAPPMAPKVRAYLIASEFKGTRRGDFDKLRANKKKDHDKRRELVESMPRAKFVALLESLPALVTQPSFQPGNMQVAPAGEENVRSALDVLIPQFDRDNPDDHFDPELAESKVAKVREAYEKAERTYQRAINRVDKVAATGTSSELEKAEANRAKSEARLEKLNKQLKAALGAWNRSKRSPADRLQLMKEQADRGASQRARQERAEERQAREDEARDPGRFLATFHPETFEARRELARSLIDVPGVDFYRLNGNVTIEAPIEELPRIEAMPGLHKLAIGKTWKGRQNRITPEMDWDTIKPEAVFDYPHVREDWGKRSTESFLASLPSKADEDPDAFKRFDAAHRYDGPKAKRLALISCGKKKRKKTSSARDLYTGTAFKSQLGWYDARSKEDPTLELGILSAKHELVDPDQRIEPYELELSKRPKAEREAWAKNVAAQILGRTEPNALVFSLAPAAYNEGWPEILKEQGRRVFLPLEGLDQFQRNKVLKKARELKADDLVMRELRAEALGEQYAKKNPPKFKVGAKVTVPGGTYADPTREKAVIVGHKFEPEWEGVPARWKYITQKKGDKYPNEYREEQVELDKPQAKKKSSKKKAKAAPKKKAAKKKAKAAPKKKKAAKKKARPKAPARARGRARERFVDPITGQPVPAKTVGAVPTGDFFARARARKDAPLRDVPIAVDELGIASYAIDMTQDELIDRARTVAKAEAEDRELEVQLSKLKGKQALPGVTGTFRTAGQAAEAFVRANELYYYPATEDGDIIDPIKEWMTDQEVWVPKKGRGKGSLREEGYMQRLHETTKGAKMLARMGAEGDRDRLISALTWVFSQARSKRYADVEWSRIDELNAQLDAHFDKVGMREDAQNYRASQPEVIYPAASGVYERRELLSHPDVARKPRALAVVEAEVNLEELARVTAELETAYKAGRSCMAPELRRAVLRRLRYLRELIAHPTRISTASICAHEPRRLSAEAAALAEESGVGIEELDPACVFPLLVEDSRRLARVCADGYDPDWPVAEAQRWEQEPERFETYLEASPPAVLRRPASQVAMFEPEPPPPAPLFEPEYPGEVPAEGPPDPFEAPFDAQMEDLFGPNPDLEIPF